MEFVKYRLYNKTDSTESAKYTLHNVLLGLLKLFAPIMPHITEEIYQNYVADLRASNSISIDENLLGSYKGNL